MTRSVRTSLAVAALAVFLTGCKVDAHVAVAVDDDGSGEVTAEFVVDDEALDRLGGPIDERLRAADLIQAGWSIVTDVGDDRSTVTATKRFGTVDQLSEVLTELSGDAGPFDSFRLERKRSQFRTTFELTGVLDLGAGVGPTLVDPSDESLRVELEEDGVDVEALRQFLRRRLDGVFTIDVVVGLPGSGSHNAPDTVGGEPRWRGEAGERLMLSASSSSVDVRRIMLVALGVALLTAAVAVISGPVLRRRFRSPRHPSPRRAPEA